MLQTFDGKSINLPYNKKCNKQISPLIFDPAACTPFYKLVCYTVLIEAMCVAIFPHKTPTTVCLGFCFHTSSMLYTVQYRAHFQRLLKLGADNISYFSCHLDPDKQSYQVCSTFYVAAKHHIPSVSEH